MSRSRSPSRSGSRRGASSSPTGPPSTSRSQGRLERGGGHMAIKSCPWQHPPVGQTLLEAVDLDGTATKEELESRLERSVVNLTLPQYAMTMIACPWSYDFRFLIPAGDVETT